MNISDVSVVAPLAGGVLIGGAVTLMLLFNGRVTGVSGITAELLSRGGRHETWRAAFLLGLLFGGFCLRILSPAFFENTTGRSLGTLMIAGFLVGFGTVMGGGCTSGHGVCGISRFSLRSVVATVTFIAFGVLSVSFAKYFLGVLR